MCDMSYPTYLVHFNPYHDELGRFDDRPRGKDLWKEDLAYLSKDHTNISNDNWKLPDDYIDWFEEMFGKTVIETRINEETGEIEKWIHRIGGKLNE